MTLDLNLEHMPPPPPRRDFPIGVIGAGFIVRDVHLVAYQRAGFNVVAITALDPAMAHEAAALRGIPMVYATNEELLADPSIQVIDVAVPPAEQLGVVCQIVRHGDHIRGVLAQKPLGRDYAEACQAVRLCQEAGITLAVNQNMRYDQSMRALKTILNRGYLGEPVLATLEMRATPHFKPWAADLGRLTLLIMSIHHLDVFRYLFGDPEYVYCSARTDPRTRFPHRDGIVLYTLEYSSGLRAAAWDDVWSGPSREGAASDVYIKWRVEGTGGTAQGFIGWPAWPNAVPSTLDFTTTLAPHTWFQPRWKETWFPDAFQGTMGQLLTALHTGSEPAISGRDNLRTMALLEACYLSLSAHRPVAPSEFWGQAT